MLLVASLAYHVRTLSQHSVPSFLRPVIAMTNLRSHKSDLRVVLADLVYRHQTLSDGLTILEGEGGTRYVPIAKTAQALGFRLQKDQSGLRFKGFLRCPSESIEIDSSKGLIATKLKHLEANDDMFAEEGGELYIDSEILAAAAGIKFDWQENSLELSVESSTGLSLDKQAYIRYTSPTQYAKAKVSGGKVITAPYLPVSIPSIEGAFSIAGETRRTPDAQFSSASLTGYGDLFYLNARYQMLTSSTGRSQAYLTLGRRSGSADLLGCLKATEFAIGDIEIPQVALLSRSRSGFGFTFGNSPFSSLGGSGEGSIEQSVADCAQAELYRGDELIDLVVPQEGKIVFENIPLDEGPNVFRVEVVQSDGNVQHRTATLYGEATCPKPGSLRYRGSIDQPRELLFGIPNNRSVGNSKGEVTLQTQKGLLPGTWLSFDAVHGQDRETTNVAIAGIHSWQGASLWNFSLLQSDQGFSALGLGTSMRVGKGVLSLEQATPLSRLKSGQDGPSIYGTSLSWNTTIGRMDRPFSYGVRYESGLGSTRDIQFSSYCSSRIGKMTWGTRLYYRDGSDGSDLFAMTDIGYQVKSSFLRFSGLYGGIGDFSFRSGQATLSRFISQEHLLSYGINYDADPGQGLTPTASIFRLLGPLAIGANLSYSPSGSLRFGLNFSTALNVANGLRASLPGTASSGRVKVRVFFTQDPAGHYRRGDKLLEGIGIRAGQRSETFTTNAEGICEITNLPTDESCTIELDDASLIDPLWIPMETAVRVIARPGREVTVDLPLIEGAEINGIAQGISLDSPYVASLKTRDGKLVATSAVDSSGGYVFTTIRPGKYILGLQDGDDRIIVQRPVTVVSGVATTGFDLEATKTQTVLKR